MHYKFFNNSEKAWKVMYEAVSGAQKSIYLEMYIFRDDMKEFDFFQILTEKGKQGLKVKIVLDPFGSAGLSDTAIRELQKSGVEILFLSYLIHRMHRKVLVVDEVIAFVGGVNLYQSSRFWNDLMVSIKGALVEKVVMSFAKSYIKAGGKDPGLMSKNNRTTTTRADTWIVEHAPVLKKFHLKRIYKKYMGKAEKSITLITPYFIPRRWIAAALHQAVLRGVNVEVLVPRTTDHFFIDRVNYFYIYKLSKLGIKFYIEREMNHAKALIIDEQEAMVGSQNLDFFSFDFNFEMGIFFKDKEAVSDLLEIKKEWKKNAVLFDAKIQKPEWFDYILSPIINILSLVSRIFLD